MISTSSGFACTALPTCDVCLSLVFACAFFPPARARGARPAPGGPSPRRGRLRLARTRAAPATGAPPRPPGEARCRRARRRRQGEGRVPPPPPHTNFRTARPTSIIPDHAFISLALLPSCLPAPTTTPTAANACPLCSSYRVRTPNPPPSPRLPLACLPPPGARRAATGRGRSAAVTRTAARRPSCPPAGPRHPLRRSRCRPARPYRTGHVLLRRAHMPLEAAATLSRLLRVMDNIPWIPLTY